MASFEKLWAGLAENWSAGLSASERVIFTQLETENERDAFRSVRSFARKAKLDGAGDFPIARDWRNAWVLPAKEQRGIVSKLARLVPLQKQPTTFRIKAPLVSNG